MKTKIILALAGVGLTFSLFKIQAVKYQKQLDKMQSEVAELEIQNKILQEEVNNCKEKEDNFMKRNDEMLAKLLKDFNNFKKSN
jgi:FtsZ-binding cell division protein ZapB